LAVKLSSQTTTWSRMGYAFSCAILPNWTKFWTHIEPRTKVAQDWAVHRICCTFKLYHNVSLCIQTWHSLYRFI
jgi:hypothetical protein